MYSTRSSNSSMQTNKNHIPDTTISARQQFPKHPKLLEYIQSIGVGVPQRRKMYKRKRYNKKQVRDLNRESTMYDDDDHSKEYSILSRAEERRMFGNDTQPRRRTRFDQSFQKGDRTQSLAPELLQPSPPLPFGVGQDQYSKQSSASIFELLPIKVLGSFHHGNAVSKMPRPSAGLPEVALIGRSNVGKSTLLNALLYSGRVGRQSRNVVPIENDQKKQHQQRRRRSSVTSQTAKMPKGIKAVTSSKPGETRAITFYQVSARPKRLQRVIPRNEDNVTATFRNDDDNNNNNTPNNNVALVLVDLPGYGFAYGPSNSTDNPSSQSPSHSHPWQSLVQTYLLERPRSSLKRILLLLDARHGMKQADIQFLQSLQTKLQQQQQKSESRLPHNEDRRNHITVTLPPIQIVLTKCDLVSQQDLVRRILQARQQLSSTLVREPSSLPELLVSAQMEGHKGVLQIQQQLAALCHRRRRRKSSLSSLPQTTTSK